MAIESAKELDGRGGTIYGTEQYIERINQECRLEPFLLANGKEIQYENAIKKKQNAVKRSLDEIFEDLKKNVETIYLLEQDDRSNLMRFIKGLDQFLQWKGTGSHKADECIAILSQDRSRTYRRASERDIRAGASSSAMGCMATSSL